MNKYPKIKKPKKPTGFYFRLFQGGEFHGRTEQVPIFKRNGNLKPFVNKEEWTRTTSGFQSKANNYKLAEPAIKAAKGATYIYEFHP